MLRVVTPKEMATLDEETITAAEVPGVVLMENAGFAVTEQVVAELDERTFPSSSPHVTIVSGTGNNGGDGFCVARQLSLRGIEVEVFLIGEEAKLSGDALINWKILKHRWDIKLHKLNKETDFDELENCLKKTALVVDALLGTGLSGPVKEPMASVIALMNCNKPRYRLLSIDIPSGVMGENGQVQNVAVQADKTITLALPKTGLLFYPGAAYTGEVLCASIGILPRFVEQMTGEQRVYYVTEKDVKRLLPRRKPDGHKGTFGKTLVIAGSRHMLGASVLTASGTLKVGGGLVTVAVPDTEEQTLQAKLGPEVMTKGLAAEGGVIAEGAKEELQGLMRDVDAVAVGPGLTTKGGVPELVEFLLTYCESPMVLDADALNVLQGKPECLARTSVEKVITPHLGEFSRLTGYSIKEIKDNITNILSKQAKAWESVIVLKGAPTLVGDPQGNVYIIKKGNAGMATGGSGDVLTGAILSLLGQGVPAREAAILGAYAHGLAGELAGREIGEDGMTARDVLNHLPDSMIKLRREEGNHKARLIQNQTHSRKEHLACWQRIS